MIVKNGCILVVDNEPLTGQVILMILEDNGYSVKYASSKSRALEMLALKSFQVAILDIRLDDDFEEDDQSGIWLMHEIHKSYPNIKVIIASGYAMFSVLIDVFQPQNGMGLAFAFFEKSDSPARLVEYVKKAFLSMDERN